MPPLKWDNSNDCEANCFQSGPAWRCICGAAFSLLRNCRMFMRDKRWKIKRGRETEERVCIACGGHYFWRAPRLGELENIILSGWFDSAMKNVRSGDDKSWCWGERTGRQGMSFVMSAIWLHPTSSLPLSLPSAFSSTSHTLLPPSSLLNFLLFYLLRCLPVSPSLSLFIVMIYLNTFYCLSSFFILPDREPSLCPESPQYCFTFPAAYINSTAVF